MYQISFLCLPRAWDDPLILNISIFWLWVASVCYDTSSVQALSGWECSPASLVRVRIFSPPEEQLCTWSQEMSQGVTHTQKWDSLMYLNLLDSWARYNFYPVLLLPNLTSALIINSCLHVFHDSALIINSCFHVFHDSAPIINSCFHVFLDSALILNSCFHVFMILVMFLNSGDWWACEAPGALQSDLRRKPLVSSGARDQGLARKMTMISHTREKYTGGDNVWLVIASRPFLSSTFSRFFKCFENCFWYIFDFGFSSYLSHS